MNLDQKALEKAAKGMYDTGGKIKTVVAWGGFAYIMLGMVCFVLAFFPAWCGIAISVYWTDRRGWRFLCTALFLLTVLLVYQGLTLIVVGKHSL